MSVVPASQEIIHKRIIFAVSVHVVNFKHMETMDQFADKNFLKTVQQMLELYCWVKVV